ncbi:MAG: hypothetical protein KDC38_04765 [Planctomycetes bacterium]|nr:hypothetical protein [Planctomycetota bacterium]
MTTHLRVPRRGGSTLGGVARLGLVLGLLAGGSAQEAPPTPPAPPKGPSAEELRQQREAEFAKLFEIRTTFRGKAITFDGLVHQFTSGGKVPENVAFRLFRMIDHQMRPDGRAGIFHDDAIRSPSYEDRNELVKKLEVGVEKKGSPLDGCRSLTYELAVAVTRSGRSLGADRIVVKIIENPYTSSVHLCVDPDSWFRHRGRVQNNGIERKSDDGEDEADEPERSDGETENLITRIRSVELTRKGLEIDLRRTWETVGRPFDGVLTVSFNTTIDGSLTYRRGRNRIQALYFVKGYR